MKLKHLQTDAHYDLVHGIPKSIEKDNDGSFLFRYNIVPDVQIQEESEAPEQVGWACREIRIWEQPTKQNLKKAIIRSVIDETKEISLVNDYNKHVLGIKEDMEAVERYKEYLLFTEEIEELLAEIF